MAARSSYTCNYFVLPCCMWDFNTRYSFTQKSQTSSETSSKYRLYLDFVKTVGENCGFKVEEDMLRIPSTKRVCFIGRERSYNFSCEAKIDDERQNYITLRCEKCSESQFPAVCTSCDPENHDLETSSEVSGGLVQLRDFTLDDLFEGRKKRGNVSDKSALFKTSLCWFHEVHPDGCPREASKCLYAHGLTKLRPKPIKEKI